MLSVAVHKDIGEYTEKVVGKLSARTLACTAGGLASSVACAALLNLALGVPVDATTLPVMAASMPFWLMGFWRPCGMAPERFVPLWARWALAEGPVTYRPPRTPGGFSPVPEDRAYRKRMKRKGAEARGYEEAPRGSRGARRR